jgi:hypothetical protein
MERPKKKLWRHEAIMEYLHLDHGPSGHRSFASHMLECPSGCPPPRFVRFNLFLTSPTPHSRCAPMWLPCTSHSLHTGTLAYKTPQTPPSPQSSRRCPQVGRQPQEVGEHASRSHVRASAGAPDDERLPQVPAQGSGGQCVQRVARALCRRGGHQKIPKFQNPILAFKHDTQPPLGGYAWQPGFDLTPLRPTFRYVTLRRPGSNWGNYV